MRILCGFPAPDGWVRAARFLGHEAQPLDYGGAILQFDRFRPDVVLADQKYFAARGRSAIGEALRRHPAAKFVLHDRPGMEGRLPREQDVFVSQSAEAGGYYLLPATSFLPDFRGGTPRDAFGCDVLVTDEHQQDREGAVDAALAAGLSVKLFSRSKWPYPQYLGRLGAQDLVDAFASAGAWVDFRGNDWSALDVVACGGRPVRPDQIAGPWPVAPDREALLGGHTLAHRLRDILERI